MIERANAELIFESQFRNFKVVYRRYAGLFFCICVDANDNELAYLEAIHLFVEVLGMSSSHNSGLQIPINARRKMPSLRMCASLTSSSISTRYARFYTDRVRVTILIIARCTQFWTRSSLQEKLRRRAKKLFFLD